MDDCRARVLSQCHDWVMVVVSLAVAVCWVKTNVNFWSVEFFV